MAAPEQADYTAGWRDLKRRIAVHWAMWVGIVPAMAISSRLLEGIGSDIGEYLPYLVGAAGIVIFVAAVEYRFRFRCPGCHQMFFRVNRWTEFDLNARKCVHCGLPRWAGEKGQE